MGADLILAYIWTTQPDKIDWTAGFNEISNLPPDGIDFDDFEPEYELPLVREEVDQERYMVEVVRPRLREDLETIRKFWEGQTDRYTSVYEFGPSRVLLSGGTSWGDSPSDMFDVIMRVPDAVFTAAGFFDNGVVDMTNAIRIKLPVSRLPDVE